MAEVLGTVLFSAFGTTVTVGTVVSTIVLPLAIRALTPKPKAPQIKQGIIVNSRDAIAPHDYVYGTVRKGGTITYMESTGDSNKFLHMIITLAGHEVNAINDIYINDQVVTLDGNGFVTSSPWNSKIRIKKHLGSPTQTVDPDLLAESAQINSNFRGQGIAYLYIRLEYDQDVFPSGIPLFSAVVEGRKVFDPRTSTTGFSSNAALCVRDYITGDYGLDADSVDDTYFSASANVSDELIPLSGGGSEKRYTMNGVITADTPPGDVLQAMMTTCGGTLWWGQGTWKFKAGYYTPPTKTLTLDDLRGPLNVQTRQAINDNFNTVRGTFNDAAQDWIEVDYPEVTASGFVAEDNGEVSSIDLSLPLTTSSATAQRLAKLALFRGREQITFTADFGMNAFDVEVGDVIAFTNTRYGWSAKEFEVVEWVFFPDQETGELKVTLTLRETSSTAFAWNAEETPIISNNTTLPDFQTVGNVSLSLSDELRVVNEQVLGILRIDAEASDGFVNQVEIEYRRTGEPEYTRLTVGRPGRYEVVGIQDGQYDVRARAINGIGVRGSFTEFIGFSATPFSDPPQTPENFSGNVVGNTLHLNWTPSPDLDLSHYKIRYSPLTSGATYSDAVDVVSKIARPASAITVPARVGTYFIKAFDKLGNGSLSAASIVIFTNTADIDNLNVVETLQEDPDFEGAKSNVATSELNGIPVIILDTSLLFDDAEGLFDDALGLFDAGNGTVASSGTYQFSDVIDLSQTYVSRVLTDVEVTRIDYVNTFDSAEGLFDSRSGLFDGDPDIFDDISVRTQVSTTPDDPSGTPVWSEWSDFFVGDIVARGIRFRAILETKDPSATPAISKLRAIVDMPDRVESQSDVSVTGTANITFPKAFKAVPSIGVALSLNSGQYYQITNKTRQGFTITVYDSGGSVATNTILLDYVAKGYGKEI